MTDPRIAEIARRLETTTNSGKAYLPRDLVTDLRYLLSLVAEQDQRIEAFLSAWDRYITNSYDANGDSTELWAEVKRTAEALRLPAPETVETQG